MLFNSFAFIFGFLPWAVGGFYLLSRYENVRLWYLLVISIIFYGYWDWRFVPLLLGSIALNWLAAEVFFKNRRRFILIVAIILDLLSLGLFKYLGFFGEIVQDATGWQSDFTRLALPLGISFFTFHNIIYLADLLRGKAPRYALRDYALYIALFPQILAGPLVRYYEIVPQFREPPARAGWDERLVRGIALFIIGLGKKVFFADDLAKLADPVFTEAAKSIVTTGQAWTAALAFPLQIYFDFSGYSDMAIGIALMLGFVLPFNFDVPYRAVSLAQFWRQWHMTLMRFLRDYVYIPLGGNRCGTARQCLNVFVTFILGGLWHGAGWTFIVWGALHGIGLSAGILWRRYAKPMPWLLSWALMIVFLVITWIFFRAPSMKAAISIFQSMAGQAASEPIAGLSTILIATAFAFIGPSSQTLVRWLRPTKWLAPVAATVTLVAFLKIGGNPAYEFIYFHF